jgi:hypothetical protein
MADRLATQLIIGGKIPNAEARDKLAEVLGSEMCSRFGEKLVEGLSVIGDALAGNDCPDAVCEDGVAAHAGRIYVFNVEQTWGDFEAVRAVCHELGLPYRQHTEGKYDYPEQTLIFRPDVESFKPNDKEEGYFRIEGEPDGRRIDADTELAPIIKDLDTMLTLIPHIKPGEWQIAWTEQTNAVLRQLRALQTPWWASKMPPALEYDGES